MAKLSKKQRVALKQIDELASKRRMNQVLGFGSIVLMAILVVLYNTLTYNLGIIDADNTIIRGVLYAIAMVLAGVAGINLMNAGRKKSTMDGYRQSTGISRETMEAWKKGEIE